MFCQKNTVWILIYANFTEVHAITIWIAKYIHCIKYARIRVSENPYSCVFYVVITSKFKHDDYLIHYTVNLHSYTSQKWVVNLTV